MKKTKLKGCKDYYCKYLYKSKIYTCKTPSGDLLPCLCCDLKIFTKQSEGIKECKHFTTPEGWENDRFIGYDSHILKWY